MDKINDLLKAFTLDKLNEHEIEELIHLMHKELNARATTIEFTGEQLMTVKEENALLKRQLLSKKVN